MNKLSRVAAAAVGLVAWCGLAVQLNASIDLTGSLTAALWGMLRYFTVIANLLIAAFFTAVALGWRAHAMLFGGATILILLVGVVYALLLRGLLDLSGGAALADFLLHSVTPVLVGLWWLVFAPKGGLSSRDPLSWAVLPFAYFLYALMRAGFDGRYPYPFMDVVRLGWPQVLGNVTLMAAGVLIAGFALVALDRLMASRGRS